MKYKELLRIVIVLILLIVGVSQIANLLLVKDDSKEESPVPTEEVIEIVKPKQVVINEIDKLLQRDGDTIIKYFGSSDVYKGQDIADRIAVAKVNFMSVSVNGTEHTNDLDNVGGVENGIAKVNLHICTLDYNKTKEIVKQTTDLIKRENSGISEEELSNLVTTEVAKQAQAGKLDIHINVPVEIHYIDGKEKVIVTEAFKSAITGNWFNPTGKVIESVECPINSEGEV